MRSEMDTIPYPTILLVVLIVVVHNTISWNLMTKNLQLWTFLSQLSKFTTPTTPSPHDIDLVNNHPFRRSQISRLSCNTHHFPSFCCYGRRTQNELPRRHAHPFEVQKINIHVPSYYSDGCRRKEETRTHHHCWEETRTILFRCPMNDRAAAAAISSSSSRKINPEWQTLSSAIGMMMMMMIAPFWSNSLPPTVVSWRQACSTKGIRADTTPLYPIINPSQWLE